MHTLTMLRIVLYIWTVHCTVYNPGCVGILPQPAREKEVFFLFLLVVGSLCSEELSPNYLRMQPGGK